MAVQGRGYYGIGASKKDFGFSNNMTLPLAGGYSWPQSTSNTMPSEGYSDRGRASFAVDKEGKLQMEYRDGSGSKKGKSWRKRLSGFFKRERKEKESEEAVKGDAGSKKAKGKTKASEGPPEPKQERENKAAGADDVNNAILSQEGLTTTKDDDIEGEEDVAHKVPEDDDDDDMVVAAEVEVEYHDTESADEKVSLTEDQENEEDVDPDMDNDSLMIPATEVQEDEEETIENCNEESTKHEGSDEVTALLDSMGEQKKMESDQDVSSEPKTDVKPAEKTPPIGKQKKKKKKKLENRKSTALNVVSSEQEKEVGKKNGKTKKQRPKSMPVPSLALADEQESCNAQTSDQDIQEATSPTETQSEANKVKVKKSKEKKRAAVNDVASTESPADKKKKSTKGKKKSAPSEQTFDSPLSSLSPPPEDEHQVPKQVTVGVINKKKQKTRPFQDISESPRSKVYQSEPDSQTQDREEDDLDAEERELLHDMDTLQLMAGEAAEPSSKKAKKKKQGKEQDTTEEATKAAKKSKQSKSKSKSVAEPEPMPPQMEVVKEIKDEKQSKVAKKIKPKGKVDLEPEHLKKTKSGAEQPKAALDVEKKQPRKKAKSKESEPEPQAVQLSPPPEVAPVSDKKQPKKTKKTKSKGKREPELEPSQEVAVTEPDKKQPEKIKKEKSKGKSGPEPEPEPQLPPPEEHEDIKKKPSKKLKSKGKTEATDAILQTPLKAAAVENDPEDEKPKKKKKKVSKASVGTPESVGSSSTRSSRSQLATKTSKSKFASEESDDLVWVGAEKLSKKSKSEFKTKDDSAVGEDPMEMDLSSSSRSTSYHELSKEDRKTFQEELRKASSQRSVDASEEEGSVKVEIDPNVKVTKSGVVKGGKGSRRPSLQQMNVFEDGGLDQTDSSEADRESSKKISMDLSAVPQTTPSLGLVHGHDRVDLVHRSSSKRRRPISQRESVLLTNDQEEIDRLSKQASGQGSPTSVARQLFSRNDGEPQSGEGSASSTLERSRRNKTVDKPVKTLGIASESSSWAKKETDSSVPSWVALAKNKQKRSSLLLADEKKVNSVASASIFPPPAQSTASAAARQSPRDKDNSIPKMGTVQARLAAFERK